MAHTWAKGHWSFLVAPADLAPVHHSALHFGDGEAPLGFPLPFLVGREGMRAGVRSRLGPLCLGVAGRGGAGTDGLDIFGRSCRRLRTSFLMCVSSYKASSRDHCCPRWSDALPRACDQLTKALGYSPYEG